MWEGEGGVERTHSCLLTAAQYCSVLLTSTPLHTASLLTSYHCTPPASHLPLVLLARFTSGRAHANTTTVWRASSAGWRRARRRARPAVLLSLPSSLTTPASTHCSPTPSARRNREYVLTRACGRYGAGQHTCMRKHTHTHTHTHLCARPLTQAHIHTHTHASLPRPFLVRVQCISRIHTHR
jgi:hypothetical protein